VKPESQEPPKPVEPSQLLNEAVDATRRTYLASERTQLAWWRTGLAAIAVALGVGRVVPELDKSATRWPYVVAGVGFALWGILAIAYGSAHGRQPEGRSPRGASSSRPPGRCGPSRWAASGSACSPRC
jgi:uncharacterized membrane protein YidH (DUF202 family)